MLIEYCYYFSFQYAHRKCVQHWCNEKGDITCEICHKVYYYTDMFFTSKAFGSCNVMMGRIMVNIFLCNFIEPRISYVMSLKRENEGNC